MRVCVCVLSVNSVSDSIRTEHSSVWNSSRYTSEEEDEVIFYNYFT